MWVFPENINCLDNSERLISQWLKTNKANCKFLYTKYTVNSIKRSRNGCIVRWPSVIGHTFMCVWCVCVCQHALLGCCAQLSVQSIWCSTTLYIVLLESGADKTRPTFCVVWCVSGNGGGRKMRFVKSIYGCRCKYIYMCMCVNANMPNKSGDRNNKHIYLWWLLSSSCCLVSKKKTETQNTQHYDVVT